MPILKIARMGHRVLRQQAEPVPDPTAADLRSMIADMSETMLKAPGVGLAAPQVFAGQRVIVYRVPTGRAGDDDVVPETALINPEIEPLTDDLSLGWEGCLSVPGLRGLVPRYKVIRYRGWQPDGTYVEGRATGFLARVLQHEFDHLEGVLYLDRMDDMRLLVCEEEMANFRIEDYCDDSIS